jgi:ABC-2 type transport system ATP-binding protein
MTDIALNIEKLNQSYEKQSVLTDINLSVKQGEYIGLVGVNGAGKTTLIKAVLDFISIDSGKIEIFGKLHRETSSRESLSFLPEKFIPPYYLTGKDFLSYMAELNQVELKDADIEELFNVLDLDKSVLKKSVRQYSKGMSQKLGLASCFLSQRPMLLFDEPMSGLDPKARAYLKRYLIRLKETGKTLFFSTHLLADVESICDRIIVLHGGKVCFSGSPVQCCHEFQADNLENAYLNCIGTNDGISATV